MDSGNKYGPAFFGLIFILILYLLWLMTRPMIEPIIFGSIIAGVFYPLFHSIREKLKISKPQAAGLTSLIIFVGVLLPLTFIIIGVSKEAAGVYQNFVTGLSQEEINSFFFGDGAAARTLKSLAGFLGIELNFEAIKAELLNSAQGASSQFLSGINTFAGNVFSFLFAIVIMMIVIFVLLVEGETLKQYIFDLSPLPTEQEQTFLDRFNQMNYVTLVCNGLGGVIQGILAGVAFWLAGLDSVLLWTFVMIILAFIPLVGISFVTVPASLYLMLTGQAVAGTILLIFTAGMALFVENWFKPRFIGGRIQINSIFVLLTIIGGMTAFGMGGIFYGPIIGILFLTIVEMYHDQYSHAAE